MGFLQPQHSKDSSFRVRKEGEKTLHRFPSNFLSCSWKRKKLVLLILLEINILSMRYLGFEDYLPFDILLEM